MCVLKRMVIVLSVVSERKRKADTGRYVWVSGVDVTGQCEAEFDAVFPPRPLLRLHPHPWDMGAMAREQSGWGWCSVLWSQRFVMWRTFKQ